MNSINSKKGAICPAQKLEIYILIFHALTTSVPRLFSEVKNKTSSIL